MTLSDISIKNTVFAWILMFGLIIFGAIGFSRMGISQMPDVDFPVITVTVTWVGASPETMESSIADVLEDSVMTIEGIRNISSTSMEGLTNITIEFELSRDVDTALQEVQTKILQAQRNLPTDIDPPIVTKSNPEDNPIMFTSLSGTTSPREKVLFMRDRLKDAITTIEGVGDVRMGGYVDPNMRIWLNTDRMASKEITVDDIINTITSQHTLTPSGYIESGPKEANVRVMSEAGTPEEFKRLIITRRGGEPIWKPIRLGDVATVEEGTADVRRMARFKGVPAVGLGIIKQRGSNAVAVARKVKEKIQALNLSGMIPKTMKMNISFDSTKFIEDSTNELLFTLTMSVILTSIVCWLFLGSWSSAFNVILAIPTSLIGSFIVLYFLGFTLNTFTLLGLSLVIGIVVDDAIMVMENIVRYFEGGMSRVKAAIVGAREITSAAVAASLAILAIFIPVVFMKGIIGKFFFQFGVTISVAVILSLLEALTLAPMRCSQMLQTGKETRLGRAMDGFMDFVSSKYRGALVRCLDNRWKVLGAASAVFAVSLLLLPGMRKEFVPPQDQGIFIATIRTPLGSSLEFTDSVVRKIEAMLKERPEVEKYFGNIGGFQGGLVNQGTIFITLKDYKDRPAVAPFRKKPTQQQFMGFIREKIRKISGVYTANMMDLSQAGFTAKRGFPIQFSVQGPDWEKLAGYSKTMMDRLDRSGLVTDVDTDYQLGMPEVRVTPDRDRARDRGVTITNIANTISAAVGSLRVAKYTGESGRRDDVRIKLLDKYNRAPGDISRIKVRNIHGEMVPLSSVVSIAEKPSYLTITRYNRERAINVFANIGPGKSQSDILSFIEKTARQVLPHGYHITFSGSSETFKESFESLIFALALGIVVAYMILGSQYNSFLHPVIILLALPFSASGAFIAMRLTGISLNIYSMIGLLLLMGIVKKNSIMLVDFTNARRVAGMGVHDALLDACPVRLRPIMMTSIATIAAAIPPAMSLGPGAETTRPMGVVVIGGVFLSTMLTLFVVPCAYSLLSRFESTRHQKELHEALESLGEIKN
ncbi:MAG TPA: efflux RND transporter permease subunit [Spirochaetota bacterium]|jgi:HAE1 family hydrophobic/amphiphilic exporter-1|nr:efflux RND transporter permease subunit [Spirochaetota bacterium]